MIVLRATFHDAPARTALIGTRIDSAPVVFSVLGAFHGRMPVSGMANVVLVDSPTLVNEPLQIA